MRVFNTRTDATIILTLKKLKYFGLNQNFVSKISQICSPKNKLNNLDKISGVKYIYNTRVKFPALLALNKLVRLRCPLHEIYSVCTTLFLRSYFRLYNIENAPF